MLKYFFAVLLLNFATTGCWGAVCVWEPGVVSNTTGNFVEGKPEYIVVIFNRCPCPIDNLSLWCMNFRTVQPLDTSVLKVEGDHCIVKNGGTLIPNECVYFTYAWNTSLTLSPVTWTPHGCD